MKPTSERQKGTENSAVLEKKDVNQSKKIDIVPSRTQIKAILREDDLPENFVYPESFMM